MENEFQYFEHTTQVNQGVIIADSIGRRQLFEFRETLLHSIGTPQLQGEAYW